MRFARKTASALALAALASAPASVFAQAATTPQQVLETAANALGGAQAVRDARTLEIDGNGTTWWLGQGAAAEKPMEVQVTTFERRYDFAGRRIRTTLTMPYYEVNVRVTAGADGDVPYIVDDEGVAHRINELPGAPRPPGYETPMTLRDEVLNQALGFYHHPLPLLRAALRNEGVQATSLRDDGDEYVLDMTTPAGPLMLRVGKADGLPHSVSSRDYLGMLGDAAIVTTFDQYVNQGGLRLPSSIAQSIDDHRSVALRVENAVGADVGNLAVSDEVRNAPIPVLAPAVATETLVAPGVWHIAGNAGHYSVLVEFPSYAVLLEAPVNDRRTLAVIERARAILPGKPLRYLVNSHHHYDHSGGVRASVANGLTLITHEQNRDFYKEVVRRPHIIRRDYLSRHPAPLKMIGVKPGESYELSEGDRRLVIYPAPGSPHSEDMLIAFLPREGILFQADMYSAGTEDSEGTYPKLLGNIRDLQLPVKLLVSGHGPIAPIEELEKAVAQGRRAP